MPERTLLKSSGKHTAVLHLWHNFSIPIDKYSIMKKDEKTEAQKNRPQTGKPVKEELPIKNPATDTTKNSATQTPGLNQSAITRDDLLPSDGDNLTN
jgi:hypothetical protein